MGSYDDRAQYDEDDDDEARRMKQVQRGHEKRQGRMKQSIGKEYPRNENVPIGVLLEELGVASAHHHETICELTDRLRPVLNNESKPVSPNDGPSDGVSSRSSLAESLMGLTSDYNRKTEALRDLLYRLEL